MAFVPMVLLLFPALRMVLALYRLRVRLRIYRWYRALLVTEQNLSEDLSPEKREELLERLTHIETQVNKMKVPASFGEQFYVLRQHIGFVRSCLAGAE